MLLLDVTSRLEKLLVSWQPFQSLKESILTESVVKYIDYLGQVSEMFSASQNNEDEPDYYHMTIELFYQQKVGQYKSDCEEQVIDEVNHAQNEKVFMN